MYEFVNRSPMLYTNPQDGERIVSLALGKSTIVPFVFSGGSYFPSPLSNLEVRLDEATQLCVLLAPPQVYDGALIPGFPAIDAQNFSGTLLNSQNDQVNFANPYAEIEWGVGGIAYLARADVLNGLALNLTGEYVRVRMGVEEGGVDTGGAIYQLAATVGIGRAKTPNAQKTVCMNTFVGGGETQPQKVPAFAKQFSVVAAQALIDDVFVGNIAFYRDPACVTYMVGTYVVSGNAPGPFPIPNGGYYFKVKPNQQRAVSAIFELSI